MKRNIVLGMTALLLFSCGENAESTEKKEDNGEVQTEETQTAETETTNENDLIDEAEFDHSEFIGTEDYDPEKMKDWPSQTYRSDGYRPSAASEWIKVIYTPDNEFINTVLYWSTNNDTPIVMVLIESEFQDGEISGWTGKLKSTDGFFDYEFGIIEDRFNLIFDDEGRMQEFIAELE
jgi:hypothetical protein